MPRRLRYPKNRMVALTDFADEALVKIAIKRETTVGGQARDYIEQGIKRDLKAIEKKKAA